MDVPDEGTATCTASGAPSRPPSAYPPALSRQITCTPAMDAQPVREVAGVLAHQHVDRSVPVGHVNEHRAVLMAAA